MKRWAIQICLLVVALVGGATVSLAAECSSDPNECTPKKLCEAATQVQDGNKLWSSDTTLAKHVSFAQELGMKCGVVELKDPCNTDPNACKISQLCEKATTDTGGTKSWDSKAEGYVAVAKEYDLACDIIVEKKEVKGVCTSDTLGQCSDKELCYLSSSSGNWKRSISSQAYVNEAKNRSLTCGVTSDLRQAFMSATKLKRQQLQYALKKLNLYSFGIDGLYGKGTETGFQRFVDEYGLKDKSESEVFISLLSRVSVPSSFASPKHAKGTTNSTSSSNSGSEKADGWIEVDGKVKMPFWPATKICKAKSIAEAFDNPSLKRRAAEELVMILATGCMAEYGWIQE